jgi:RAMP superfamily
MSLDLQLQITLLSDATFGRGDGVAGLVDEEVEYDETSGLPFIRGRVLKGLLTEECANVLYALNLEQRKLFKTAAEILFGNPGSKAKQSRLNISDAELPAELREAVLASIQANVLSTAAVLESLTALRRQTAVDEESGAPEKGSLRTMRVVLRGTVFTAPLVVDGNLDDAAKALLAACVLALRRLMQRENDAWRDVTVDFFAAFKTLAGVTV